MTKQNLILLSLNELNFDYVNEYLKFKKLDNLKKLSDNLKIKLAKMNTKILNLDPMAFIYTGKKAQEHKIFRLGDS